MYIYYVLENLCEFGILLDREIKARNFQSQDVEIATY